jgi:hypothetical protein
MQLLTVVNMTNESVKFKLDGAINLKQQLK